MRPIYILDACAFIAAVNEEPGAGTIRRLFAQAKKGEATLMMHKLNLLEAYYGFLRPYGKEKTDKLLHAFMHEPVEIVSDISDKVFREAGRLKAAYKISLADSIALAQAVAAGGSLVTSDHHEFDSIESGESIRLFWFR